MPLLLCYGSSSSSSGSSTGKHYHSRTVDVLIRVGPRLWREYPLNLSILISGGKETNRDSLSRGD